MGRRAGTLISPGFRKQRIPRDLLLDPPRRKRRVWLWLAVLLVCGALLVAVEAVAEEISSGELSFKSSAGPVAAVHVRTEVTVSVTGMVAKTEYVQVFRNDTDGWQEAIYRFPLPDRAAVHFMQFRIGDRLITGEVQERRQAKKTYEAARKEGRAAALTEQQRPNLFTQSVANIPPGEEITVTLRYLDVARFEGRYFSLRLPLTYTPRYSPGGMRGDWLSSIPFRTVTDRRASITAMLNAGVELVEITSDYHQVIPVREGARYRVQLARPDVAMDRDFVLRWRPVSSDVPTSTFLVERTSQGDYGMLMVLPPAAEQVMRLPREMIFVVDTSGSMKGTSIRQARAALLRAIETTLGPQDQFNVIEFDTYHSMLFQVSQPVTHSTLSAARKFVSGLHASGGTEMAAPLEAALDLPRVPELMRHIIFVTDGAVANEAELFRLIHDKLDDASLYTVGIGSAPNSYFMRKAAEFGRGTFTFIGDTSEVVSRMDGLARKLARPAARDLRIDWLGNTPPESFPGRLPALYAGEPLILLSHSDFIASDVSVSAQLGDAFWNEPVGLQEVDSKSGIGTLWAREKIAALEDEGVHSGDRDRFRKEIIELALAHQLVSRFTSLVAVESWVSRQPGQAIERAHLPGNIPRGQVVAMPQTATRAPLSILLGLLALAIALLMPPFPRHQ